MAYTNSSLVTVKALSPNYTADRKCINRITIHHCASNPLTAKQIANIFASKSRGASCNYGIGNDGSVALIVDEKNRAWTSSNPTNDRSAITFEVSNSKYGEPWAISDKAYAKMIDLCVDICKRNGMKEVFTIDKEIQKLPQAQRANFANNYVIPAGKCLLTQHNYFNATACPGTYIKQNFEKICADINKKLGATPTPTPAPTPTPTPTPVPVSPTPKGVYMYNKMDYAPVFNPQYYSNKYVDLKNAFGNDTKKLWSHFTTYGMKEGRQAIDTFNPTNYMNRYPDLKAAFGSNMPKYYEHYLKYGIKEGRNGR